MKIIYKLILSYIIISFLIGIVGLLGYQASEQIITFYKEDNKNFRTIVSLANEISNSVKSAEAHFMLYITMNSEIELDEFFKQYNILNDKILALENKIHHPFSLKLLNNIKLSAKELYVQGKMLVNVYEDNIRQYGKFNPLNFKMQILNFHKLSSKIRKLGVKLAAFKTDFLNRQEAITAATEITSYVKRAEGHLMLYLTLHDNTDRNKFFERFKLLNNYINILEHKTKSSKARSLVGQIKIKTNKFYPLGIELIKAYDGEFKISKSFNFAKHTKLIDSFHNISNEIKDLGFKLTILNVNIENKIIEDKRRKAKAIQQNIYIIVACTIFISIIIAIFLSKTISKSISTLKKAAVEIGKGKLDTKINIKSKDEIGELGQIISHMANELQTHQKHLEELVDSKTIELKSAVEQLNLEIVERKLTEEALCESEARFRILAEATSEGIIIHQDGIILDVNQAIMDTVGYKNL
ncbi:MAG: HAMP domain-containing protein, partial [Spirochaetota bacterium]|nr:HAMP domain-containing protein [Spirochaetota bacterium]